MTSPQTKVAVVGATGYIGSAIAKALDIRGVTVQRTRAPRHNESSIQQRRTVEEMLVQEFSSCGTVVNAAGAPDATAADSATLAYANTELPKLLARACARAETRFIHVSSAAVQGRLTTIDSSPSLSPFSAYSRSKADGETLVRQEGINSIIYRPPGVHSADRRVTQKLAALARSRLAIVASPGHQNAPHALLGNVADAISFLATYNGTIPEIVSHPSEGLTVAALLEYLGGKAPTLLEPTIARAILHYAFLLSNYAPFAAGNARRLEILWLGQEQASSWLTSAGWTPPYGVETWIAIGEAVRKRQ